MYENSQFRGPLYQAMYQFLRLYSVHHGIYANTIYLLWHFPKVFRHKILCVHAVLSNSELVIHTDNSLLSAGVHGSRLLKIFHKLEKKCVYLVYSEKHTESLETAWLQLLAPPFVSSVISGSLPNFSLPSFSQDQDNKYNAVRGLL